MSKRETQTQYRLFYPSGLIRGVTTCNPKHLQTVVEWLAGFFWKVPPFIQNSSPFFCDKLSSKLRFSFTNKFSFKSSETYLGRGEMYSTGVTGGEAEGGRWGKGDIATWESTTPPCKERGCNSYQKARGNVQSHENSTDKLSNASDEHREVRTVICDVLLK